MSVDMYHSNGRAILGCEPMGWGPYSAVSPWVEGPYSAASPWVEGPYSAGVGLAILGCELDGAVIVEHLLTNMSCNTCL